MDCAATTISGLVPDAQAKTNSIAKTERHIDIILSPRPITTGDSASILGRKTENSSFYFVESVGVYGFEEHSLLSGEGRGETELLVNTIDGVLMGWGEGFGQDQSNHHANPARTYH